MAAQPVPDPFVAERALPVPAETNDLWNRARTNLADRAGIDDRRAGALLNGALRAAQTEVLRALADETPLPASVADQRAYRLYVMSNLLNSTPEAYEVEAVFRVPRTTARSIITRMEATFQSLRERDLSAAVAETLGPPRLWRAPGERRDRYEVEYDAARGRDALRTRLRRLGVTDIRQGSNDQAIAFPQVTPGGDNTLDALGLPRPENDPG